MDFFELEIDLCPCCKLMPMPLAFSKASTMLFPPKKEKERKKRLSGGTLTVVSFQNCEPQMFLWATLFSEVKLRLVLSQS